MTRGALTLAFTLLLPAAPGAAGEPLGQPSFDTTAETTYRKIRWEDFKGRDKRERPRWAQREGSWVQIVTDLRLSAYETESTRVSDELWHCRAVGLAPHAVMDKLLSFAGGEVRTPGLLAHEQTHFDLTEAVARGLGAEFARAVGEGPTAATARFELERQIKLADRRARAELRRLHDLYDQETRHGGFGDAQRAWRSRARKMLRQATDELRAARREVAGSG